MDSFDDNFTFFPTWLQSCEQWSNFLKHFFGQSKHQISFDHVLLRNLHLKKYLGPHLIPQLWSWNYLTTKLAAVIVPSFSFLAIIVMTLWLGILFYNMSHHTSLPLSINLVLIWQQGITPWTLGFHLWFTRCNCPAAKTLPYYTNS
jgi:hypothetical protein